MSLEGLCAEWLKKNFNMVVQIREATVLEQEEIDKALNLIVIECNFTDEKGVEGYTAAFLDANEVPRIGTEACFWSSFYTFRFFFHNIFNIRKVLSSSR